MKWICNITICLMFSGCEAWTNYNSHVSARQIGVGGNYDSTSGLGKGQVSYRVEYR